MLVEPNPERALGALLSGRTAVDAVVASQRLPGMSGLELAAVLSTSRPDLPVFFVSGSGGDLAGLRRVGVQGVLRSPLQPEAVARALRDVFDRASAGDHT